MPLQWVSKDMIIGDFVANALHLFVARERMSAEQCRGLRTSDLKRDDRQNFAAVVRRSSNLVRERLSLLQTDPVHPTETQGTVSVYYMLHLYLLIFFSKKSTLADRFQYGGYVIQFLRLWRVSIQFWPDKAERNLDKCFYPNQTFRHVLMSVQSALMFILGCAIMCPHTPCGLRFLGSDCCEKLFAMVGGWGLLSSWQRNFSFMQMLKKITDMNSVLFFATLGNIWHQTHRSDKCEFDGRLHEDSTLPDADLTDYPTPVTATTRWHEGMRLARVDLTRLGVRHAHIPANVWEMPWLYDPPNPDPDNMPFDEYVGRKYYDPDNDSDYDPDNDSDADDDSSSVPDNDSDTDGDSSSDSSSEGKLDMSHLLFAFTSAYHH